MYQETVICGKFYYFFFSKKSDGEIHDLLVEAYKEYSSSASMCEKWIKRFKSNDYDLDDEEHRKPPKKIEDSELEAILADDTCQTEKELEAVLNVTQQCIPLRLSAIEIIQKKGNWVPH